MEVSRECSWICSVFTRNVFYEVMTCLYVTTYYADQFAAIFNHFVDIAILLKTS